LAGTFENLNSGGIQSAQQRRVLPTAASRRVAIHEAGHCAAAVAFAIPIISVTVLDRPRLHRGTYRPRCFMAGLERIVTLCLAGPEAERAFCGPITDGSDGTDRRMAREYLLCRFAPSEIEPPFAALPRRGC
jgi:hypothetical protein